MARHDGPHPLTEPQRRMLGDVLRDGERVYNGRARSQVEALARVGLVEYGYELVQHSGRWTERYTVRPKPKARP